MSGKDRDSFLALLPEHLVERIRQYRDQPSGCGEFVLYWIRSALRTEENPALDIARILAHRWGLPLLVYQGLSENYPYASDRHHTFILQGAQVIQKEFAEQGISYGFHLATRHDRRPHLANLSRRAAVVVTEDMPVDAPLKYLNALAAKVSTPILCVDTACVVPMGLTVKAYDRAFHYRRATTGLYANRLKRKWPKIDIDAIHFDEQQLPFKSVDLQTTGIPSLVAACDIDHAVGPVAGTTGGSASGYLRWNEFRTKDLSRYARRRNNALVDGVSRMSPYLHYGMVSPMRIAREAAESENAGAEKFLDELLIWRELAYAFCFHRADYDQWSAIPEWARRTLTQHAQDPRPVIYSWEQLARASTQDPLWNAAQKSLLVHGELHNNLRMTWGKAILNWTASPQQALQTIIDLNHRYALDGRDPASYGGILWCLGQFDRPFHPEQPVIGSVRPRTTIQHAKRLNTEQYLAKVISPVMKRHPHVAIVGAGISGLAAGRVLSDHGLKVTVFEKSRGVGGRMATRRLPDCSTFDHGAQYFTVRDPRFKRYVDSWIGQGIVAIWPESQQPGEHQFVSIRDGQIEPEPSPVQRFVGVPAMNSICKHLATDLGIKTSTRVKSIIPRGHQVQLLDEYGESLGEYERVVVSAPSVQTAELLSAIPDLSEAIDRIQLKPCWAVMVTLPKPLTEQWVGAFLQNSILSWVARDSTKPGRTPIPENLVLHATPEWTQSNWELDASEVAEQLISELRRVTGRTFPSPVHLQAHRWKYAVPVKPGSSEFCFYQAENGIAACGDWAHGDRVEGAFLSGMAAAGRILGDLAAIEGDSVVEGEMVEQ